MSNSFYVLIILLFSISAFGQNTSIQQKIKAKYTFENNTNDVSGNNHSIEIPLPLTYSEGIEGEAIQFLQQGERLEIPHRIATLDTSEKAISFWFYASELKNNYNNILDKTSGSDYSISIDRNTQKLQFTIRTEMKYTIFECPLELKKWYFVVISKNESGIRWYVNAEQKGFTPVVINLGNPNPLIVGAGGSPYQHGYGFNGKIDELTFYTTWLTEKEILELFEQKDVVEIKANESFQIGNVLFKRDEAELLATSHLSLNKILTYLNNNPKAKLKITGHTDDKGSQKHNLALSTERAKNVRAYFIEKGIKANRIKAIGKGGSLPIASNKTEEGMSENRRVEFFVH